MANYEYRVIESANGTFNVELRETHERGRLLYEQVGFQTRQEAEVWMTPVEIKEPPPIARTTRTRRSLGSWEMLLRIAMLLVAADPLWGLAAVYWSQKRE